MGHFFAKTAAQIALYLLFPALLSATNVDSLQRVLAQQRGSDRLPTLLCLCDIMVRPTLDSQQVLEYAHELMALASEHRDTAAWVEAYLCAATKQRYGKHGSSVEEWLRPARQLAAKRPDLMARVLYWQGAFLTDMGGKDSAIVLFNQGLRLFERRQLPQEYRIRIAGQMMRLHSEKNAELAVDSFANLLLSWSQTPADSAEALRCIATSVENLGRVDAALSAFLKAYQIEKRQKNNLMAAHNLRQAANILRDQKRYGQAIQYYEEAIQLLKNNRNASSLASIYHSLALLYKQTGQVDMALRYGNMALDMKQKGSRVKKQVTSAMLVAELYHITGQNSACLALCQEYLPWAERLRYDEASSKMAFLAAMSAHRLGRIEEAASFLKKGDVATARITTLEVMPTTFQLATESHAQMGHYEQAYQYQLQFQKTQDSIYSIEKSKAIAETEARYETEKKEQRIAALAKENQIKAAQQYGLVGTLVLLIALATILLFNARTRQRHNRVLTQTNEALSRKNHEVETLLREIHHRVKNNLQIVTSLLRMQARKIQDPHALEALNASQARVRSMALLHQRLYQGDVLKDIPMRPYLTDLASGLLDAYQSEEKNIALNIDVDDTALDVDTAVPVGLIANELLTNALKHAFPQGQQGSMSLSFVRQPQGFQLEVADNGVGFPLNGSKPDTLNIGFGLDLVETLAEKLNAQIAYQNGQGSRVALIVQHDPMSQNQHRG